MGRPAHFVVHNYAMVSPIPILQVRFNTEYLSSAPFRILWKALDGEEIIPKPLERYNRATT